MVSSFNYAYKLIRESSAILHKENYWIAWFVPSRTSHLLNLETLEYRRLFRDLTLYYKVVHNLTPWAPSDFFNIVIPPHNLHSVHHDFNMRKPLCRTNIFVNDFFNRRVCAWNSLPSFIVNSKSMLRLSVLLYLLSCIIVVFIVLYCSILLLVQSVILHVNLIMVSHLAVLYHVTTIECASFTSLTFITVFIAYLLNY